ncbi:hypothetical protein C2S52_013971 [Perilla frutescens var. hirtella]|uniref:Oligopeptide transporter n=1 Tax=Perilla frutescens var. hirtella TaxID=608512 RepID=A0AAD4JQ41_PERFH|nr:hypothetical protein C2S52_013971 [Perilla frutescens var. hirtella]KAH6837947.1 hypothetical protein C2S53_000416 [Perilla frutescens var. hirtella]
MHAGMCNRRAAERKAARPVERWRTVDENEDDEAPVWTFRVMVLGCVSFVFLLVVNKYLVKETCECVVGMALTIVVVYPLGYIMGKIIPKRMVYYPTFGLEFSINDGPFGFKEYAVISIFANLGATIGGLTSSSIDDLYYI